MLSELQCLEQLLAEGFHPDSYIYSLEQAEVGICLAGYALHSHGVNK